MHATMYDMDSNEYEDKHAKGRDQKREKRVKGKAMRGNRSVFTIQDVIAKKGKQAKGER